MNSKKFAKNLIDAIEQSKSNDLDRLICAIGIRHIGTKSAKTLARRFKTMENLKKGEKNRKYFKFCIAKVFFFVL